MREKNSALEFELNFSDLTIIETNGDYGSVKNLMEQETYKGHKWMISSDMTIESIAGFCSLVIHFYSTGKVYIVDYIPSATGEMLYNPDLSCLSVWAQDNGWDIPQPSPDLTRKNLPFWKEIWEMGLVDSDYLEERFGKRNTDFLDFDKDS